MARIRKALANQQESQGSPDLPIIRQLDALMDAADNERDRRLGPGWFEEVRGFYNIDPATYSAPTFRPRVVIPELQVLLLNEATDLSDAIPRVFITKKTSRDKDREKAYQENWRACSYNNRLLEAQIWALFGGTGFVMVGFDASARHGRGEVYLESLDPDTVHPDPGTRDPRRWAYVQLEQRLYVDEIRSRWPDAGYRVVPRRGSIVPQSSTMGAGMTMPAGPMSVGPGATTKLISSDSICTVRHTFIRDFTTVEISKEERERLRATLDPLLAIPTRRKLYPGGRWIVDCEDVILADGPNPFPLGLFPIIPFRAMPSVGWFWGVPPMRYTRLLQAIAERMMTQTYENAVRLNNGVWFIDEATGLTADDFAGLPAEIQVVNSNARYPEVRWPSPLPQHMTQLPNLLLDMQRRLQGYSPNRQGATSPGNQSADLFDSTLYQSQFLTRLRSRLMSEPTQQIAELVFYTMCRYYRDGDLFAGIEGSDVKFTKWESIDENKIEDWDIMLDPASLKPISMTALRGVVMELLKTGKMPLEYALKWLEVPDAEEIAETMKQEMELSALARLKRPR